MNFTFTATLPSLTEQQLPPEPPDKGENGVQHKLKEGSITVSFRDKVLGSQTVMIREKVDLLATNQAQVELIRGNRLMSMLHVERTVIEELSIPWKDALVVKLLGKNLGYGIMKKKLESVWKFVGENGHNTAAASQTHRPDSEENLSHTVVQPNWEVDPELLHGDWIKVERRKKGNKMNSRGSLGNQKGTPSVSKFGTTVKEQNVDPWLLTVVYASPREQERGETWNKLRQLAANINESWLMVGDFNEIASPEEKKGGVQVDIKKCQQFNSWIYECNLLEVTTAASKFTWRGPKWNERNRIFKKLDRILCNINWRLKYHEGFAKVLPRVQSDHHPIIVFIEGEPNIGRDRPFRFEAAWFCHEKFHSFLKDKWGEERELIHQLYNLTPHLKEWNKDTFDNIFKRKKELLARLNVIQRSANYGYSSFLDSLEKELQEQLAVTLYQEECLWFQKSRGRWIADGDRNTKYYHSKTIVRRRRNKIISLRNEEGEWVDEQDSLRNMVRTFYTNLYKEDQPIRDPVISWSTYPMNLEAEHIRLSAPVSFVDCKKALFDMGPHKAPGEDGYPAIFFQHCWDIVGESIYKYVNQVWSNTSLISFINNIMLVLIPKVDKPEFVSQFRPIALCNVTYKIITKVIVNRIKPLLDGIISPYQSSFIPGRIIHYNIIVAQEMVHSMAKMKEASIEQAHCVMHCLDQFCQASGQKINNQKTQVYFSKNVDQRTKDDILQHTGFTHVNSLGKYLGANIAPGRTTRGKFQHIIGKMQDKLSGWKHQCLSLAGRLTLTKSDGGLGIRNPHQMNIAFLMKMLWNMINRPEDLWCKVFEINSNDEGNWNLNFLNDNLPPDIVNQLVALPVPRDTDGPDFIGWKGTNTRHFTVQSAYDLQQENVHRIDGDWTMVWNWKGPHKIQTFMWDWFFKNLSNNEYGAQKEGRKSIFMVTCWYMWQWRNKSIFDEDFRRPSNPIHAILKMVRDIDSCKHNQLIGRQRKNDTIFVGWKQPPEGWIKLNCDGAYKESLDLAGCGGLLRDSNGQWIHGYTQKIGACDALHAEMWGMYVGMNLARRQGVTRLILESDSKLLVDMVTWRCNLNGATPILIRRIKGLIDFDWQIQFKHTWREGNRSADWLANHSLVHSSFDVISLETPPRELQSVLFDDIFGACMPRNVCLVS
ncbi:hypothetical protein TSUD_319920 [Trifolium subterraneum]|uniref:RNase H type-1 domain-containing protein n=1 Tax=Trifolium subterraneum TaxID=3900 RepID=A0A2Z6NEV5_TRISU|nr:hypothetical protein TSUD_319920 [Trifolium subterraneum]